MVKEEWPGGSKTEAPKIRAKELGSGTICKTTRAVRKKGMATGKRKEIAEEPRPAKS